jgi:arylamine N-acetyltransferase
MFERGGDCEDFALTKYFALRSLGFDDAAMRIAVVWDGVDREEHAVLLVRVRDKLWLLDNKAAGIEPAAAYADRYRLIYSVNASGATLATTPSARADAPAAMRWSGNGRALILQIDARPRRALAASR